MAEAEGADEADEAVTEDLEVVRVLDEALPEVGVPLDPPLEASTPPTRRPSLLSELENIVTNGHPTVALAIAKTRSYCIAKISKACL